MPRLPLGDAVDHLITWLTTTFPWLFDAVSAAVEAVVSALTTALTAPPAWVWIALFTAAAYAGRGWRFGSATAIGFALVDDLGLWEPTMQTLAVVLLAALAATVVAVPTGIAMARNRWTHALLRPVLDTMQTMPVFVYLIPAVFFFGVGTVPGVVATTVFAVPPGARLTELGIRGVDPEAVEAARAFGAGPGQILRGVQLPLAWPSIMTGINQVIMMALSMVVVAGMAGAAGLGAVVVTAVNQLDVSAGFEGGLAVVVLAVYLDRLAGAVATRSRRRVGG